LSEENSGGSKRMPVSLLYDFVYEEPIVVEVDAVRIDDLLGERAFDLVLMDIEGSEIFALRGMRKILSKAQVLCVEFIGDHLRHVAGVTSDEFVDELLPHFNFMRISDSNDLVSMDEVKRVLRWLDAKSAAVDLFFYKDNVTSL
jgi:hypothetical protein